MKILTSVLVFLAALLGMQLQGSQPAFDWDGSGAEFFSDDDGPFVIGFEFRVESNITVTALGAFDYLGDGLATPHRVGLWALADGALITEATIPAGMGGPLLGQFRYISIPGTWLSAGRSYVVAASDFYGETNDIYAYGVSIAKFRIASEITFLSERETMSVPGGLEFPLGRGNPPNGMSPGASFQFVPGPLLTVQREASGLELSWPNDSGYHLEFADTLPTAIWKAVTNTTATIAHRTVMRLTNDSGEQRYFRLARE